VTDLTTYRLIVNAVWHELARDRWRGPTSTRDLDTRHATNYRPITSGRTPNATKRHSCQRQTDKRLLIGTIHPDQRLGTTEPIFIILTRENYETVMRQASQAAKEDLHHAITNHADTPYAWHVNGRREWHLERRFDPWQTPLVLGVLHHLADACQATRETVSSTTQAAAHPAPRVMLESTV
jgi:hypothetical protein